MLEEIQKKIIVEYMLLIRLKIKELIFNKRRIII